MADVDAAMGSDFEYGGVKYARLKLKKYGELVAMRRAEKREQLTGALSATTLPAEQKASQIVSATTEMIDIYEMQRWMKTESGFRATLRLSLGMNGKSIPEADAIIDDLKPQDAETLAMIAAGYWDFNAPAKADQNPPVAAEASTQSEIG